MSKKPKISQEDLDLFQEAVKGTKPLSVREKREPVKLKPTRRIRKPEVFDESLNLSEADYQPEVNSEEFISFKQDSLPQKSLRKLRKGQYNVDAILDLHGMTVEKALTAVDRFLQECLHNQVHVALIIHGKGHHSQMPILKNKLNLWLRKLDVVLAFCSAAPRHGSRGAVYVLLKRTLEENLLG